MMRLLWLIGLFCMSMVADAQGIVGSWKGELDVKVAKLRLVLHIGSDGKCALDSPDQGAKGIPGTVEFLSDDSVAVDLPVLKADFRGKLRDGKLSGWFAQMGQALPLTLQPGTVELNRPQTPKPPFDYRTEEVTFRNEEDDATLCGTLTYPVGFDKDASPKVPVVLMVTGSGLQNRDEEIFGHKPFAVLADYLAKRGIASLRYDDRGAGKSTGDVQRATTYNYGLDAMAGIDYLKARKLFGQIGVLGHSEGGTIAFLLAGRNKKKVDFVVSMAGAALGGDSVLVEQNYVALRMNGLSDKVAAAYGRALKEVLWLSSDDKRSVDGQDLLKPILLRLDVELPESLETNLLTVMKQTTPWMEYFVRYNPSEDIRRTQCPVLAINGSMDVQVLPASNLGAFRQLLPAHKNTLIKEYPGLNHLFQHCLMGSVAEYNQIEETLSEEVMQDIADWILAL